MQELLEQLPYSRPFLFVDEILQVSDNNIEGIYTFSPDLFFYKGHFKENPVTPGVIITECMAQIGLVCLGIYLSNKQSSLRSEAKIAMTSTDIEFLKPVFPGEKVRVCSEKQYFRFNKLKCKVEMYNCENIIVAKGTIAGMIIKDNSRI
ncbi:3-hydroxyacyl-ACP dehydratase FabZ family protein [Christiangramia sabulilitoris]|uniref:Beta-hydroxyacyl-ACP dehydratase n=1 Tax=Christiangramia sabulilitoris TaxID=2583991 RepID=A0A550I687_9FLAO|nr:3-hydroxyacyl-ACP dehydratase FabZ family protein [Christiangramia sabulilitoris]TRO66471.1 beta-hydroxyacyl-ACP dehydratase [Christiangramia sabulilitoris]